MVTTPEISQDLEAEKAVAAICVNSGPQAIEDIQLETGTDGLFTDIRYAEVFRRCEKLAREGKRISFETVNKIQIVDPLPVELLMKLEAEGLPASFIPSYLPALIDARKRRHAIFAAQDLAANAQDLSRPIDAVIDETEQALFAARFKTDPEGSIKESLSEAVSDWETAHQTQGRHTGVDSGFYDWDHLTWGFQPRNLVIIGARPSQGKTALLCNIAEHASITNKVPTLFFSLEMTRKELLKRMVCSMAHVSSSEMRAGRWTERDFPKVTGAMGKINVAPITIIDRGTLTINGMRTISRRHVAKHGIRLILVDYLQKVRSTGRHEKRTYEVGEVSTGLKELAKECNCPVVVACQLNREPDKDKGRAPRPSVLGDSGMIERDADIIAMLHRKDDDETAQQFNLYVAKHRDGPCGSVRLTFLKAFTRFESQARVYESDTPKPYAD